MAFIAFVEGENYLLTHGDGLPSPCFFALSTRTVSAMAQSNTLAGGIGEITGTGYVRQSQTAPTPSGGVITFAPVVFNTGSATNWSSGVNSVVMTSSLAAGGVAICAWDLSATRNMAAASTTETITLTLNLSSGSTPGPGPGPGPTPGAYDAAVAADTPVLYVTNNTTDASGNSHQISNVGGAAPQLVLPNGEAAWVFNGSNYLSVTDPPSGDLSLPNTGMLTVECWFNPSQSIMPTGAAAGQTSGAGYTNFLGKGDFTNNPATSDGLSEEYEFRLYNSNTTSPLSDNGPYATCAYIFNPIGQLGAGHDDREPKPPNNWYYMVGLYTTQSIAAGAGPGGTGPFPNGYVQQYFGMNRVTTPGPLSIASNFTNDTTLAASPPSGTGPIIDTLSSHAGGAPLIQPSHTTAPFTIGIRGPNESDHSWFYGAIGKVAVYNHLLSPTRIQAHWDAMMGGSGPGATPPTITSIFPSSQTGLISGQSVAITGTNLSNPSAVSFGSVPAVTFAGGTATSMSAVAPAQTAIGTYNVKVTTVGGQSASVAGSQYTYNNAPSNVGQSVYDTAVLSDAPLFYLDGSSATSNKWGTNQNIAVTNHNVTTAANLPNGDNSLVFNGTNAFLYIPDPSIAHPGDTSLSVVYNATNRPQFSYEFWMKLTAMDMPHSTYGMAPQGTTDLGATNIIAKALDGTPPYDPLTPTTDGNEWQFRYFNASSTDGNNPPGDICGYFFNTGGGHGSGFDDHVFDGTGAGGGTGKTTAMWFHWVIVCDMRDQSAQFGANYANGSSVIYCGIFGNTTFTGTMVNGHAPMAFGTTLIQPVHTTAPLTIGSSGWTSNATGGAGGLPYWQGTGFVDTTDPGSPTITPGFYDGQFGKFAIYNKALTQTQVHNHFAAMHP